MCRGLVPSWAELPDSPKGAHRTQCGAVCGCGFPNGAQNDPALPAVLRLAAIVPLSGCPQPGSVQGLQQRLDA